MKRRTGEKTRRRRKRLFIHKKFGLVYYYFEFFFAFLINSFSMRHVHNNEKELEEKVVKCRDTSSREEFTMWGEVDRLEKNRLITQPVGNASGGIEWRFFSQSLKILFQRSTNKQTHIQTHRQTMCDDQTIFVILSFWMLSDWQTHSHPFRQTFWYQ